MIWVVCIKVLVVLTAAGFVRDRKSLCVRIYFLLLNGFYAQTTSAVPYRIRIKKKMYKFTEPLFVSLTHAVHDISISIWGIYILYRFKFNNVIQMFYQRVFSEKRLIISKFRFGIYRIVYYHHLNSQKEWSVNIWIMSWD